MDRILTKNDLRKFLREDMAAISFKYKLFAPNTLLAYMFSYQYAFLWSFLKHLRWAEYCYNCHPSAWKARYFYHSWRMRVESRKLGNIEIPINTLGYGTKFPHIGKIIINKDASIGNHCTLYPGVCIGKKSDGQIPSIGDNVFIGLGAKIIGDVEISAGSIIAPNAVVLKCPENQAVIMGGVPARVLKML